MQLHSVLQGNMQIALQTKPEKPAMGRRVWNLEATATDGTVTRIPEAPLLPPPLSPPVLALAQPPHTGLGRSRLRSPRALVFRAGPGAPPPKPSKPSPGCWPPNPKTRERGAREDSAESARQGLGWLEGSTRRHLKGKLPNFAATRKEPVPEAAFPALPVHIAGEVCNIHAFLFLLSLSLMLASVCTRGSSVPQASVLGVLFL